MDKNNDKDKDTDKESPSPSPSPSKEVSTASISNSTTNKGTASSTQDPKAQVPSATSPTAPASASSQSTTTGSSLPSSSSLLDLATAACQSVAADSPQFKKIREVLAVDVNTGVYLDNLKNILTDANFLRRHVPDVFDMRDEEFGLTRDLVCVVLSHLQGRVVTANGFCKTSRTNHITSWRGKCQASGTGGKRTTNAQARRQTVKCHCNYNLVVQRNSSSNFIFALEINLFVHIHVHCTSIQVKKNGDDIGKSFLSYQSTLNWLCGNEVREAFLSHVFIRNVGYC
jgi:hypothetical protein